MFRGTPRVAALIAAQGRGHQEVIAGATGTEREQGAQVPAGPDQAAAAHEDLGQASLGFFGYGWGKFGETGKPVKEANRVLFAAQSLEMPCPRQQTVGEVERRAHGAASVQVMGTDTLRGLEVYARRRFA